MFISLSVLFCCAYGLLAQESVRTVVLEGSEKKIALYDDGSWSWIGPDGERIAPAKGEKIVLSKNGNWALLGEADRDLPDIQKSWDVVNARHINTQVPNGDPARPANAGTNSAAPTASSGGTYYTIKSGDTLSAIAARNHTTVAKLCQMNGIKATSTLKIGQKLKIK